MAPTPLPSNNGHRERTLSPAEAQVVIMRAMLKTLEQTQDVAAEQTWQAHALLLAKHTPQFLDQLGMPTVLKMQAQCAEMVLKIRMAARKGAGEDEANQLAEYEQMLEEIFRGQPDLDERDEGAPGSP